MDADGPADKWSKETRFGPFSYLVDDEESTGDKEGLRGPLISRIRLSEGDRVDDSLGREDWVGVTGSL